MNKKQLIQPMALIALLSAVNLQPSTFAQGTAFTYQGQLTDNGNPANGSYDLTFAVFDALTIGTQVSSTVTNGATSVSNGQFTVTLDFGPGVFTGDRRWLEIGVSTNGSGGAFTTLTPRQAITPTPYAILASTASNVVPGSVVTTVNALRDDVTLAAGANVTITPSGNTLTIASAGAGGSGIWSVLNNNAYYNAGNVGIGTNIPISKLHIVSGASDLPPRLQSSGTASFGSGWDFYHGAIGKGYVGVPDSAAGIAPEELLIFGGPGTAVSLWPAGARALTLQPGGNVGIGTVSPQAQLHVYDPTYSVTDIIETGGDINAWAKTAFKNLNGEWDIGTSRGFHADVFYIDRIGTSPLEFQLAPNGNLGLGVTPLAKLHLYDPAGSVSHRIETAGGINSWTRIEFANATGQWDVGTSRGYNGDQLYFAREGAANASFAIQPNGDTFANGNLSVCTLTIRGGCDLAEPFPMQDEMEKGSVVVIDSEHPGQLKLSTRAYDTRVAGIVSGGNGINPGIALRQEGALADGQNVALTGRVYVQADAAFGAINPGDLLTTSDTPGHAMKVSDHAKAQGAILGKAMSSLEGGKGMVLVLVTLQ
jgi:hypothetical protein